MLCKPEVGCRQHVSVRTLLSGIIEEELWRMGESGKLPSCASVTAAE